MKNKEQHRHPTLQDFYELFDLCNEETQKEYLDILRKQPRPDTLAGESVPTTLNHISYGQLDDLRSAVSSKQPLMELSQAVFGKVLGLLSEDVNKVFGFVNFCTSELNRINALFQQNHPEYSPEEKQAGVEKLNFGSFGVLDWYAKRMGIADQNQVRDIAWVRIYTCMRNDHQQQMFEKRLQEVYMHKSNISAKNRR